ncbi:hypothetical protein A2118_02040 [Candidatus Kaiserbacteria bacterium GWA2_50_9]|uniref:Uncharacterized protein n=1 Tax=Candidatus Kaiserbacteria bacterium GWA2_50_9 TaxID=1798474 RepID=A0A1F6BV17_9BACT|nr:MAG: hypothetical protein A2118_02040 [Candidatus Kaiserbacteria bacterium GWA2_50_9]
MKRKILFLFSGSRERILHEARSGEGTDTALRGMNHIPGAEYLIAPRGLIWSLFLIPRLLRFDIVIAQDELFLGYVVSQCARMFRFKTKWLYITMTSSTLIRRHATHPVRLFLFKQFWASYSRIICLSSEQLEDLVQLGIAREHLVFVPFGIDAQFFQPASEPHEENLIVSVGRDAGRDYKTLFRAAEHTKHSFVVVASKRNIPLDISTPSNISVLYDQPLTEVRDLYAHAWLVVVPSKDASVSDGSDCSGQTVILDALAAGKAVIATRRSWIADYFVPGQDLVVIEPNDSEALARAINELWGDEGKQSRLAESGQAKVVAHYTTKAFAKALLLMIDSVT